MVENYWTETDKKIKEAISKTRSGYDEILDAVQGQFLEDKKAHEKEIKEFKMNIEAGVNFLNWKEREHEQKLKDIKNKLKQFRKDVLFRRHNNFPHLIEIDIVYKLIQKIEKEFENV